MKTNRRGFIKMCVGGTLGLLTLPLGSFFAKPVSRTIWIVPGRGNDETANGEFRRPFASVYAATRNVRPGDMVAFLSSDGFLAQGVVNKSNSLLLVEEDSDNPMRIHLNITDTRI